MHTTFGCACLLTDEFVVVADVFFRKDDGKGSGASFSQFASEPPASPNGKDTPSTIRDCSFSSATSAISRTMGQRRSAIAASSSGVRPAKSELPDLIRPILSRSRDTTLAPVSLARCLANVVLPECEAP